MEGFLRVLQTPDARKIFGKAELKIIEKQAWGVRLSQSEKNRLSRDIRRKLVFIQEASRFSDEFRLKKGAALRTKIGTILDTLQSDPLFSKVKTVWLFGSSVTRKRAPGSDVDVAVEFSKVDRKTAFDFRRRILGNFGEDVDLQVENFLPEEVKAEIRKGTVLYDRTDRSLDGTNRNVLP